MTLSQIAKWDIRKIRLVDRDDRALLAFTAEQVRRHEKLGPAGENSAASELGQLLEGVVRGRLARVINIRHERHLGFEAQERAMPGYEPQFIEFDAVAGSTEEGALRFFEIKTTRNPKSLKKGLRQLRRLRTVVSRSRRVSTGLCLIWVDSRTSDHEDGNCDLSITPGGWDAMARLVNQPIDSHAPPSVVSLPATEAIEWAKQDGVPEAIDLWQRTLAEKQQQTPPRQRSPGSYSTGDAGGMGALGIALSEALGKERDGSMAREQARGPAGHSR